jgi:hypothetical protein
VPPGRARRHRRLPVPGLLCRDPARSPSTRQRGRRASATGGACACGDHRIADRTHNRQIGPSSAITAGRWHARRPVSPSDAAIRRRIAVAAPTAAAVPPPPPEQQILQIPIASPAPRGFVHGRFPYAGLVPHHRLHGRRPKTFTKYIYIYILDNAGGLHAAAKRTSEVRSQAASPERGRCRARSSRLPMSPVVGGSTRGVLLRLPGCRLPQRRSRCR